MTIRQLKLYLKQRSLQVSGSKVHLIERVLALAWGTRSTDIERKDEETEDEVLEDDEDEISSEEDTSDSVVYIEQSFQVLFAPDQDIGHVNMFR